MKKKMLITLGCSYTEGVGCYEPIFLENGKLKTGVEQFTAYDNSRNRFHTEGWPAKLQKLLNYDYLINLGSGSASNLYTLKRLMEFLPYWSHPNIAKEYDVVVIWLMTHFGRHSIYLNKRLHNMGPWSHIGPKGGNLQAEDFMKSYLSLVSDEDLVLENFFQLKTVEYICALNNFTFMYLNTDVIESEQIDMYNSKISLNKVLKVVHPEISCILELQEKNKSFCFHPNEEGYSIVAERIFNCIKLVQPTLISSIPPETFRMEYYGNPQQW